MDNWQKFSSSYHQIPTLSVLLHQMPTFLCFSGNGIGGVTLFSTVFEPPHEKTNISLHCALNGYLRIQAFFMWAAKTDHTRRMPRLIWVFAGRKAHFVGFLKRRLISCLSEWWNEFMHVKRVFIVKANSESIGKPVRWRSLAKTSMLAHTIFGTRGSFRQRAGDLALPRSANAHKKDLKLHYTEVSFLMRQPKCGL